MPDYMPFYDGTDSNLINGKSNVYLRCAFVIEKQSKRF